MTHRESFTLAAVTFLLGAIIGAWAIWKLNFDRDLPLPVTTTIEHWREVEKKIHDTITRVEVRREQLAGEVVYVTEHVDRFDSAQVDSCLAGIPGKTLCLEHSIYPIHLQQIANLDSLASLQARRANNSAKTIDTLSQQIARAEKRNKWHDVKEQAKGAVKGGGAVLLFEWIKNLFK